MDEVASGSPVAPEMHIRTRGPVACRGAARARDDFAQLLAHQLARRGLLAGSLNGVDAGLLDAIQSLGSGVRNFGQ
jgi:hypothetical protein